VETPPHSSSRACPACGKPVDPLRAPVVAILDGRFVYFCSQEHKTQLGALSLPSRAPTATRPTPLLLHEPLTAIVTKTLPPPEPIAMPAPVTLPSPAPRRQAPIEVDAPETPIAAEEDPDRSDEALESRDDHEAEFFDGERGGGDDDELAFDDDVAARKPKSAEDRRAAFGRGAALGIAGIGVALALVDASVGPLRLAFASVASLLGLMIWADGWFREHAAGRATMPLRAIVDEHLSSPIPLALVASTLASAVAFLAREARWPAAESGLEMASWMSLAAAVAESIHAVTRARLRDEARTLAAFLDPIAHGRLASRAPKLDSPIGLQPGVALRVDATVTEGSVEYALWGDEALRAWVEIGGLVPAGAEIRSGSAMGRVVATGRDRLFARLLSATIGGKRTALGTFSLAAAWHAIVVVSVCVMAGAIGGATHGRLSHVAIAVCAAALATLVPSPWSHVTGDWLRAVVSAHAEGVAYRDWSALRTASECRTFVYCVRGTLVASTPAAVEVIALASSIDESGLLAIASGLARGSLHPLARAIVASASESAVAPLEARRVRAVLGLGFLGEHPRGGRLVLGARGLCLQEHIPTAEHEARLATHEDLGHELALLAYEGRLIGAFAAKSELRAGALNSVQRLRDLDVEPVLLGGSSRQRLESLARQLDIANVRAEIASEDVAEEIRAISHAAGPVAVLGNPALDATAINAADLAISIVGDRKAGASLLAMELDHAAAALSLPHVARLRARATIWMTAMPPAALALAVILGLVPAALAPLSALGAVVALAVRELMTETLGKTSASPLMTKPADADARE
jgi:cation transport ATPase